MGSNDQSSEGQRSGGQIRVRTETRCGGRVATVTIDNAARLNAMTFAMVDAIAEQLAELARDEELRAVVMTGAGERAFTGGVNIAEMAALDSPEAARGFITRLHRACDAARTLPVPVIARIAGYAFGGGLELAASCDVRIAADTARFGMPEVKMGIPSVIEAALLPGLIGWGRTRRMLLGGGTIGAEEALSAGLVEQVVPLPGLDAAVDAFLGELMTSAPRAVRLQKQLMRQWEALPLREAIAAGVDSFAAAFETGEPAQAMSAFLASRQARRAS